MRKVYSINVNFYEIKLNPEMMRSTKRSVIIHAFTMEVLGFFLMQRFLRQLGKQ